MNESKMSAINRSGLLAALLAAILVTWLGYFAYHAWGTPFLPAAFSDLLFAIIPGALQAFGISLLGESAKALAFYLFCVIQIAALSWVGIRIVTHHIPDVSQFKPMQFAILSLKAALALGLLFLLISATGTSTSWSWLSLIASPLLTAALFIGMLVIFFRSLSPAPSSTTNSASPEASKPHWTRRDILASLASILGILMLWPWLRRDLLHPQPAAEVTTALPAEPGLKTLPPVTQFDSIEGLSPRVTPIEQFYYVSKNLFPHQAKGDGSLRIEGLVERPLDLKYSDLGSLQSVEEYATLMCVDYEANNPETNDQIGNALWKGVSLDSVLKTCGVQKGAATLEFYASDGYSTAVPLALVADHPQALIAYEMNGQPLDAKHGFPARLIIPGIYGYKNTKHITKIVVSSQEYEGYWERRGWADQAPIKIISKIYTPGYGRQLGATKPVWIAGVAFAGLAGISKVEISTDDGQSWQEAGLEEPLSPYSWTRWAYSWTPNEIGTIKIQARATDKSGILQESIVTQAFPAGSTGYHTLSVEVTS
ncbi:molybdopterin-dependent oxidoreductase [Candidatus Acetothermia bacterium]|nr:molybdopterin-dependent oxidoreductase [Candidatus Acetothermia bacterium]MBI3642667.1 molybdopterin-dependent oxidoreductase [Candidatus Acetothermia bacterium]